MVAVSLKKKKRSIKGLKSRGISSRRVYHTPIYRQPAYIHISKWKWARYIKYPDYRNLKLKVTEEISKKHFEVPVHPSISEEQAEYIGKSLNEILRSLNDM